MLSGYIYHISWTTSLKCNSSKLVLTLYKKKEKKEKKQKKQKTKKTKKGKTN
jgi:hypothetical protein